MEYKPLYNSVQPFCKSTTTCEYVEIPKAKRVDYVDLAKGICILLVIVGHTECADLIHISGRFIRMPFYFITAGLFFKDYGSLNKTVIKKINRLVVPAIFFLLIGTITYLVLHVAWNIGIPWEKLDLWHTRTPIVGAMWFLFSLFWCNVFYSIIYYLVGRKLKILTFYSILFTLVGIGCSKFGINLPLFMDTALTCMPFFFCGYLLKNYSFLQRLNNWNKYALAVGLVLILVPIIVPHIIEATWDLKRNIINFNFLGFYTIAIIGVIALYGICSCIRNLPIISYVGRYSIIILGIHQTIILFIQTLSGHPSLILIKKSIYYNFVLFILTVTLSILFIPLFRKFFPKFTAQKDLF